MENTAQNVVPIGPKPHATYVAVDPDTAARWLEGNKVNRNLREGKVIQYAKDMAADRWMLSNDAIAFAPDGTLLNGQHRLHAVIRSGKTIVFLVIRNMPPESMTAMDCVIPRSAGDALKFAGEHQASALAAAAKLCLLWSDGRIYKDNKLQHLSHGEIMDFVERNPTVRRSISEVAKMYRNIDAPPSAIHATHWIISGVNEYPLATYYIHQLASRANEPSGSAVLAVDSRLREIRRNRGNYPVRNYIYLLVKGWNYYAHNQPVRQLNIAPRGQQFRIPDPAKWVRG